MRNGLIVVLVLCLSTTAWADYRKLNKQGNEAYSKRDVEQALKYYQEAEIEKPQQPVLDYNIGTALYDQAKYEDAVKRYSKSLQTDNPEFQADAYYNMGSSFFRSEKYAEAINAYQKCLELKPEDVDAKYNLELSRKKLKEQAQQQQNQDQNQQQQDQDKQDQQQQQNQQGEDQQQQQDQQSQSEQDQQQGQQGENDEQKKDKQQQQGQGEQEKKDQGQQQQQGSEGNTEQQQGKGEDQKMSKEDADRILKAIGNSEKDLQKKINRTKVKYGTYDSKNDW